MHYLDHDAHYAMRRTTHHNGRTHMNVKRVEPIRWPLRLSFIVATIAVLNLLRVVLETWA